MKHTSAIPRISKFTLLFLIIIFILNFLAGTPKILGATDNLSPDKITELINKERKLAGLRELSTSNLLTAAAYAKAQNMVDTGNFEHSYNTASGRVEPWQFILDSDYNYSVAGENLARDFDRPDILLKSWMDSPGHRANILAADYKEVGVAVLSGPYFNKKQTNLVVVFFASPQTIPDKDSAQSFTTSEILLPKSTITDIISMVNPRFYSTTLALTFIITAALILDYTHHKHSTKPALKHWKKR